MVSSSDQLGMIYEGHSTGVFFSMVPMVVTYLRCLACALKIKARSDWTICAFGGIQHHQQRYSSIEWNIMEYLWNIWKIRGEYLSK